MEFLTALILIGAAVYLAYRILNKEDSTGRHPLDSVTKKEEAITPVPAHDVAPQPVAVVEGAGVVTLPSAHEQRLWDQSVANVGKDQSVEMKVPEEPAKKTRKPRAPKAETVVAKKTTAKKPATKKATTRSKKS